MYRRDLRDESQDCLLADMAMVDSDVQAAVGPDGRVAYVKTREGSMDLWLLTDDGERRLTSEGVLAMRYGRTDAQWFDWSPDGDLIAFVTADSELATVDADTGQVDVLTDWDGGIAGVAWGPAGIAVVTDHFSRASLAVVSPDGDRFRVVADDEYLYADPRWQSDALVATQSTHEDFFDHEAALVRVPLDGDVKTLFAEAGVRAASPRPRPEGDGDLAFVHDGRGYDAVYGFDGDAIADAPDGGDPVELYAVSETEVADPVWNDAGDELAVTATADGRAHVHTVAVDGAISSHGAEKAGTVRASGDAIHSRPAWDGDRLLTVRDAPATPPSVVDVDAEDADDAGNADDAELTPSSTAGLEARLPAPEAFTYESDDQTIHAMVHPPADDAAADSVPLLVKAHGGPTAYDGFEFDYRAAYFAALGYAVVRPNYRGSDGFGRAFRMANDGDWGGGDLDDVIRAADATAERYDAVDGDRVGIFGGSGGGLMTVNALGNSDRFRCGAAFYGVYDYETFLDDTDDVGWQLMKRELGNLVDDLEAYRDASPIQSVPDIDDPLAVLHGAEDSRVPISQSEQLVDELAAHDVRHEFRRYEGEPHGFLGRENVVDAYTRVADLFAKYLQRAPDDGSSQPYEPPAEN
ncbi:MAG: prolyl oligopeptidase family serine peptidase [Halopenitus sp.]